MRKKIVTSALMGLACAGAFAQSSVTIFGVVDTALRHVSNSGFGGRTTMAQGGLNASRLGFRGVEDLGGGMSVKFWLEGGFSPDSGAAGGAGTGFDFTRESHVTLVTPYGEVRMGRDYTATFWNTTWPFEPFGNNGIGSSVNIARFNGGSNVTGGGANQQPASLRASNSISYFLPAMGGWYGQFQTAIPEGVGNGKYTGARLGYAAGPYNVAAAVGRQNLAGTDAKYEVFNLGASYDFGFARLVGQYNRERLSTVANPKETRVLVGAVIPVGAHEIHASYVRSDLAGSPDDAIQLALGYVHRLSKRTALYGTVSQVSNKGGARFSVSGGKAPGGTANPSPGGPTPGGTSRGFEFGVRHFF